MRKLPAPTTYVVLADGRVPTRGSDTPCATSDEVVADLTRDRRSDPDGLRPARAASASSRPAMRRERSTPNARALRSGSFERPPLVLIVDDAQENCDLYREGLTATGYRVTEAHDGQHAIERAIRDAPDVIVMDLQMPVMDGYVATRLLKGDPRTKHIPIVVVTASGVDCHARATRAGCDAFLVKPCLLDDLDGVIRSALLLRRPAPSAPASSA